MTNSYCESLAAQRVAASHKLKEVGDQWRTPDLFWGINAMFGPLVLDLFADDSNAKCPAWYTAEDNALTQDWSGRLSELGGAAFGNPPYSRSQYHEKQAITGMTHIMNYAAAQREKGGRYVFPAVSTERNMVAGRCGSCLLYPWANWFRSACLV
jgi:phage N-6-adenine-methyltransferase